MNDHELQILLDGMAGVPALTDRRASLRALIDTRRRRHRHLAAAAAATVVVALLGTIAVGVRDTERDQTTLSAAPIVSERKTAGGDSVAVHSLSVDQIIVEAAGIDAMASTTDRPVAPYTVLDPPATSSFAVTGSTITLDEHGRQIIILVVHIVGDSVDHVRVSMANGVSDEAAPSGRVAVLVLRPTNDDELLPHVRVDAITADGATVSSVDIFPFTQRPWGCDTNTQLAEAQPGPAITADSSSATKPEVPTVALAPPMRARCPGD